MHRAVYDEFVAKLLPKVSELVVGDPADEATDVGPVCTVQPYDTEDDAFELANATPYGLQAGIAAFGLTRARLRPGG